MVDCIPPRSCPCCECNGVMCYMDHPGHSHRARTEFFTREDTEARDVRVMQMLHEAFKAAAEKQVEVNEKLGFKINRPFDKC